jgi:sulfatase maturation enzyme AslB (radical SAM superfamily)
MSDGLVHIGGSKRPPRLSIVVPVSRDVSVIRPLIESFERQTASSETFELVFVTDDETTYSSPTIQIRTVRSPMRHPCVKRNTGAGSSASEFLGFVDDDVIVEPGWVACALSELDGDADVVTGPNNLPYSTDFRQVVANAIVSSKAFSLKKVMSNEAHERVRYFDVSLCNVAMRRTVFDHIGGFNEVAYYWIDDAEFFFLAERDGFRLLNAKELKLAHMKRPIVWALTKHYFRQRWHAGKSTWMFPELYLPQLGVRAAIALLVLTLLTLAVAPFLPGRLLILTGLTALVALGTAGVIAHGAISLSPEPGLGKRLLTGVSYALATGSTLLGFWCGLLAGPAVLPFKPYMRRYREFRYRNRAEPFERREIVQGPAALVRQTVPYRVWQDTSFPQWLIFFITARCNARCSMCFYWQEIEHADHARELSLEEIRRMARSLPKITYLSLSGGEPYLRQDIVEIVQAIIDTADPMFVSIPTNGAFPDRVARAIDILSRRNPNTNFDVHLSLDGPAEIHNRIRVTKAASFDQVMATHKAVLPLTRRRANVGLKFVVTCSTENVDSLDTFLDELSAQAECDRIHLIPLHGNFKDKSMSVPNAKYMELAEKAFRLSNRKKARGVRHHLFTAIKRAMDEKLEQINAEADLGRVCGAGQKIVVLGPYGDVQPCEPLQKSVGNLRDHGYDFQAVLRSQAMAAFAKEHLGPGKCNCNWGCAIGNALVYDKRFYPAVARQLIKGFLPGKAASREAVTPASEPAPARVP